MKTVLCPMVYYQTICLSIIKKLRSNTLINQNHLIYYENTLFKGQAMQLRDPLFYYHWWPFIKNFCLQQVIVSIGVGKKKYFCPITFELDMEQKAWHLGNIFRFTTFFLVRPTVELEISDKKGTAEACRLTQYCAKKLSASAVQCS